MSAGAAVPRTRDKGEAIMKVRMVVVFFFLAAATLMAQTFRGTILGAVTDPSGKQVLGATVVVRNVGTGLELSLIHI